METAHVSEVQDRKSSDIQRETKNPQIKILNMSKTKIMVLTQTFSKSLEKLLEMFTFWKTHLQFLWI